MTKAQKDLLTACRTKKIKANYSAVREYAYSFKKYDSLTMREIDEVVIRLKSLKAFM